MLGLGGCRLYPFLARRLLLLCRVTDPWSRDRSLPGHDAAGAHPECLLTSSPSAPGPWGPSGAAEPDQAVPGRALLRRSWAAVRPGQWLSLVVRRDVQRCRPAAPQPLAGVCGCPVVGGGFICVSGLEQLE